MSREQRMTTSKTTKMHNKTEVDPRQIQTSQPDIECSVPEKHHGPKSGIINDAPISFSRTPEAHSRNYRVSCIEKPNQMANRKLYFEAGNGN